MKYDIIASIVTSKKGIDTFKIAVDSFLNTDLSIKVCIIDNSPTDDLKNYFNDRRIEYLFNNANIGFDAGHNIILKQSPGKSKYNLVLNPNVQLGKGTLEKLFNYMNDNEDTGLAMPKVFYPDGSIQYLCKFYLTPADMLIRKFVPSQRIAHTFTYKYEMRFTDYNTIMYVPFLSGCFMFLRTDILKGSSLFDERYFMYFENLNLCKRIDPKHKKRFYPEVSIHHHYKKGSTKNFRLQYHHISSTIKYFNKWGWFFDRSRKDINSTILKSLI